MARHANILLAFTPLAAFLFAACETAAPGPHPATLAIDAPVTALAKGDSLQLTLVALAANGDTIADATVRWTSQSPLVATVSASGLVTGLSDGTSQIVAHVGRVKDTVQITVRVACSSVLPQGTLALASLESTHVGGVNCVRAGRAMSVRGLQLVVPTDYRLQLSLYPVLSFDDRIVITNAAATDTVEMGVPRITGSGGR